MISVLQLIPTLDRSGAEKQMMLLAAGLPRDRFRVEVAALTRLGPLERDLRELGIPVTLIGKRHKLDPFTLGRLVKFMKAKRFDVVQTWIFAANVYGRLAARWAKVPVVITAEMAVDLWKSSNHLMIDRKLASWTHKVVGNSHAVVDFYRKSGIPEDRLAMIYSGIGNIELPPIDRAQMRAEFGWPADAPVLLFAGRLAPQKGVDDLLKALDLLHHVMPNLRTLIVGDGPDRSTLETLSISFELNCDNRVCFTGHREDVPRLLAASDALVLPSLYEGLPNIVLEAMKLAKPVVATRAPGTDELVVHQETGLLVPVRDHKSLAQAIRTLLGNPEQAREWGLLGRQRVDQHFRINAMVDQFANLYEAAMATRH